MSKNDPILLTFDIDWAPDFAVDEITQVLLNKRIKTTFFVSHNSAAIERLRKYPALFELGLHPNFYPDSDHGRTEDEVMKTVKDIVPGAISMRTHGLYQNSRFLKKAARDYGIKVDVSLLLPYTSYIQPHILNWGRDKQDELFRIPYFWEDDLEILSADAEWTLEAAKFKKPGLKIFNFHPIHIALNTTDYQRYETFRKEYDLSKVRKEELQLLVNSEPGPKTFFIELVERLHSEGGGKRIGDIYEEKCKF